VTLTLAGMCPDYLPSILASKRAWNAWLTLEAPGDSLAANADIDRWKTAASSLASLQISSVDGSEKLLKAGAHDLRPPRLLALVEPFFEFASDSTGRSPLQSSGNLTLLEVSDLKEVVRAVLDELDGLHLSDTVGHMDLNPGNIFCTSDRAIFLDWAEGFVGNPLFSFQYLLQHFRRTFAREPATEEQFRNAYLEPWRNRIPPKNLQRTLSLSPVAALFGYAATVWSAAQTSPAWTARWERYLLRLVRKMKNDVPVSVPQGVRP
jgi:Phosphotransferase enzyme family